MTYDFHFLTLDSNNVIFLTMCRRRSMPLPLPLPHDSYDSCCEKIADKKREPFGSLGFLTMLAFADLKSEIFAMVSCDRDSARVIVLDGEP